MIIRKQLYVGDSQIDLINKTKSDKQELHLCLLLTIYKTSFQQSLAYVKIDYHLYVCLISNEII
jgi:hypothetical protein